MIQSKKGWITDPASGWAQNLETQVWHLDGIPIWITRDQRAMHLGDMEVVHIQRCIANILIRGNWRLGYLPLLVEELERRTKAGV